MRTTWLGGALTVLLILTYAAGWWCSQEARAQRTPGAFPLEGSGELIAFTAPAQGDRQLLMVVDPLAHVVCAYHVDTASGEISLRSVRNIHCDLQLLDFNGSAPSPQDIRSMLDRGRGPIGTGLDRSALSPPPRNPVP